LHKADHEYLIFPLTPSLSPSPWPGRRGEGEKSKGRRDTLKDAEMARNKHRQKKLKRAEKTPLAQRIKTYLSLKHPITRFCLLFLVLLVVFTFLLSIELVQHYFYDPFTSLIASQAAWILKTIGLKVHASGITISGEGFSVKILANCNAIFEIMLFLSAVIAFPALLKEKLVGGILGSIFIYLLNLLRVVILFLIGVYSPQFFEETHIYVSQSIFIVMVAMFWLFWVGKWVRSVPAQ
jgi:exosortase H (IPTLxxWG-CTERM-specific)